jgi:predicted AAA+ superfamily ATPase
LVCWRASPQSLAGRVGRVELLPLSAAELSAEGLLPASLGQALLQGGYPALYDRPVSPADWFANYVASYVGRDVSQLVAVRDLSTFQTFVRMCAARTGQLLNLASLGADCGISAVTARHWLTVLESSYVVTLLRPHHRHLGKRLVKTPKLYFLDSGLAAWLGIQDAQALETHAARGALFETWVVSEQLKQRFNAGRPSDFFFWRDHVGQEIDIVIDTAAGLVPMEVKSGSRFAADWADAMEKWGKLAERAGQPVLQPTLVYGGMQGFERHGLRVWSWAEAHRWCPPSTA